MMQQTYTITDALDSLATLSKTPDFNDAMEVVWFAFDPKEGKGGSSTACPCLSRFFRGSLDGNVKPPIDLPGMYQERYRAQRRTAV
jgi:hypothetical protein